MDQRKRKIKPKQMKIVASIVIAVTIIISGLFLTAPSVGYPERKIGDPLTGYWMVSSASGCFKNEPYILFQESGMRVKTRGNERPYAEFESIRFKNDKWYVKGKYVESGHTFDIIYQDHGYQLFHEKALVKYKGENKFEKSKGHGKWSFQHCSYTITLGDILLALRVKSPKIFPVSN
jgi:hypothetical protein